MKRIFSFFAMFFFSNSTLSAEAPRLSLDDRFSTSWAANDSPMQFIEWLKVQMGTYSPENQPLNWAKAHVLYLQTLEALQEDLLRVPNVEENLKKVEQIANDFQDRRLAYEVAVRKIKIRDIRMRKTQDFHPESIKASFEEQLNLAKEYGFDAAIAITMADYAYYLRDVGEANRSLQLMLDANKLVNESKQTDTIDKAILKLHLALAFAVEERPERAKELYEDIVNFCEENRLRNFCGSNLYNLANLILEMNDTKNIHRAGDMYKESLQFAIELGEIDNIGANHNGLIAYYGRVGDLEKAAMHAKKGIEAFSKTDNKVWIADCYKKLAREYVAKEMWREAIEPIDSSLKIFPDGYRKDFKELYEMNYKVYKALGNEKEALKYLEKSVKLNEELIKEKETDQYSKMVVGLGLQMEEEKNKLLQKDNELKKQKLEATDQMRKIMLIVLGLCVLVMITMVQSIRKGKLIKTSKIKMQRIMENIEEGILTLNRNLEMESEYSDYLQSLFGKSSPINPASFLRDFFHRSSLNGEEIDMLFETLRVNMGNNEIQWTINDHLLPQEVAFLSEGGNKIYIAIYWQALLNSEGDVEGVLVGMRDATERKKLEEQVEKERLKSDKLTEKIMDLTKVDAGRSARVLQNLKEILEKNPVDTLSKDKARSCLRELHTIKGAARTLGLKKLSAKVHEAESCLQACLAQGSAGDMPKVWQELDAEAGEYLHIVNNIFNALPRSNENHSLCSIVSPLIPELSRRLSDIGVPFAGLEVVDKVIDWPEGTLNLLGDILVHALTNSVDHGFEAAENRAERKALFSLIAERYEDSISVKVLDNGKGIQRSAIESAANKIGVSLASLENPSDVLFLSGATSKSEVNMTSGRGEGLGAIKDMVTQVNGKVTIDNRFEGGTQLSLSLPIVKPMAS